VPAQKTSVLAFFVFRQNAQAFCPHYAKIFQITQNYFISAQVMYRLRTVLSINVLTAGVCPNTLYGLSRREAGVPNKEEL
jgi:hypothetical protein